MTYDCFSFFNELDILEIRLATLYDTVDRFVIAESNYTHTGQPKPLYFKENEARFARFSDKIIHVVSRDPATPKKAASDIGYSWICENIQRNATIDAIRPFLHDNDVLIISDLDEIPKPQAIRKAVEIGGAVRLRQKLYYYYLNYRNCTSPFWTSGSVVLRWKDFRNEETFALLRNDIALTPSENRGPTATKVRFLSQIKMLRDGGWHFSYMGGIEAIVRKLHSIADGRFATKCTPEYIQRCIDTGNDPFNRGEWYAAEKLDAGLPDIVHRFPNLIFNVTPDYLRKVRMRRLLAYAKGYLRPFAWKLIPRRPAQWLSKKINSWT